ncbi:MAG: putative peptidoglycan glycosyltransferase FtsW [Bifidobacteriaceae bacterium]|nr:putative peptidoglycan glycosyltransferase FtsW [Bifidobacteriaceae bacterium]
MKFGRKKTKTGRTGKDSELKGLDKAVELATRGSDIYDSGTVRGESYEGMRCIFNPVYCFYGFIVSVTLLTFIGLTMVYSSSSVSLLSFGEDPWTKGFSQTVYAGIGFFAALAASMLKADFYKRISGWLLVGATIFQGLTVTVFGHSAGGHAGWVNVAGLPVQPAEFLKCAICLSLPYVLINASEEARKAGKKRRELNIDVNKPFGGGPDGKSYQDNSLSKKALLPYAAPIFIFVVCFIAIMLGKDLGTAMIILIMGVSLLFVAGISWRWLASVTVVSGCIILLANVIFNSNRMVRILAAYSSCSADDVEGVCWQAIHGNYALASGGMFGLGLGNSREKWSYLPAAQTDFILAVIGEELGFVGVCCVILLFIVFAWCIFNMAMRHPVPYNRLVMTVIGVWIVAQALVNIFVVAGYLPVMGLPLPFISYGGSSIIMCLAASGVCLAMAKDQPEIASALKRK